MRMNLGFTKSIILKLKNIHDDVVKEYIKKNKQSEISLDYLLREDIVEARFDVIKDLLDFLKEQNKREDCVIGVDKENKFNYVYKEDLKNTDLDIIKDLDEIKIIRYITNILPEIPFLEVSNNYSSVKKFFYKDFVKKEKIDDYLKNQNILDLIEDYRYYDNKISNYFLNDVLLINFKFFHKTKFEDVENIEKYFVINYINHYNEELKKINYNELKKDIDIFNKLYNYAINGKFNNEPVLMIRNLTLIFLDMAGNLEYQDLFEDKIKLLKFVTENSSFFRLSFNSLNSKDNIKFKNIMMYILKDIPLDIIYNELSKKEIWVDSNTVCFAEACFKLIGDDIDLEKLVSINEKISLDCTYLSNKYTKEISDFIESFNKIKDNRIDWEDFIKKDTKLVFKCNNTILNIKVSLSNNEYKILPLKNILSEDLKNILIEQIKLTKDPVVFYEKINSEFDNKLREYSLKHLISEKDNNIIRKKI